MDYQNRRWYTKSIKICEQCMRLYKYLIITSFVFLFGVPSPSDAQTIPCHQIQQGGLVQTGFGVPYDVVTGVNALTLTADCNTRSGAITAKIGSGSSWQYIYEGGYHWFNNQWVPFKYSGPNPAAAGSPWYIANAGAAITSNLQTMQQGGFFIGYICTWTGNQWKCGCRDSACTNPNWQLQTYKAQPNTGGSTSGSTSGGSTSSSGSTSGGSTSSSGSTSSGGTSSGTSGSGPIDNWPTFDDMKISDWTNGGVAIDRGTGDPGSMRVICFFSHFNYDDPIVFPGVKNATHLHMFFGNTLADYQSTVHSIENSGEGTCQGGPLNRTAYWVPALIDQNGNARIPQSMLIYYKNGALREGTIEELPSGLKMVVGNANATQMQPERQFSNFSSPDAIKYQWYCGSLANWQSVSAHSHSRTIPNCPRGHYLSLQLFFPQCWDGRLDSANHKDHLRYPKGDFGSGECPSSHPRRLPRVTYNIYYNNNDSNTAGWYLSSDRHNGHNVTPGMTTHADWFSGWHPEVMKIFIRECTNNPNIDCKEGTISQSLELNQVQSKFGTGPYDSGQAPRYVPVSSIPR